MTARTSFYNHERASNISTWPCLPGPRAHAASINDLWVFKNEVLIAHDITILQNASRYLRRVKVKPIIIVTAAVNAAFVSEMLIGFAIALA